tara:strand:+ start:310 stop:411 length:102 start_codon:yes stop_codon:yes gene_type:complete
MEIHMVVVAEVAILLWEQMEQVLVVVLVEQEQI